MLFIATSARASSPLTLTWNAPPECPTREDVAADVEKRLGASTQATPLVASANVTRRHDATWQVVLSTQQSGAMGERTLEGPTCNAVASAAALILTLTIDPQALARPAVVTLAPLPKPITPPKRIAPPSTPRERARHMFARLAPVVGFGVSANFASAGISASFGARADRFSVELVANAFAPESHDVDGHAGAGGTFWLVTVGGSACAVLARARVVEFGACAGLEVQGIHGNGYGVLNPMSGVAGWAAPTASLTAGVNLTPLVWIAARVDEVVPLSRPTFLLDGVGTIFSVFPAATRASLGVELRF